MAAGLERQQTEPLSPKSTRLCRLFRLAGPERNIRLGILGQAVSKAPCPRRLRPGTGLRRAESGARQSGARCPGGTLHWPRPASEPVRSHGKETGRSRGHVTEDRNAQVLPDGASPPSWAIQRAHYRTKFARSHITLFQCSLLPAQLDTKGRKNTCPLVYYPLPSVTSPLLKLATPRPNENRQKRRKVGGWGGKARYPVHLPARAREKKPEAD